jgi:hypothetical protein
LKPCAEDDLSKATPENWLFKGLEWDDDSAWKKRDKVCDMKGRLIISDTAATAIVHCDGNSGRGRDCAQDRGRAANDIGVPLLAPWLGTQHPGCGPRLTGGKPGRAW